MREFWKSLLRGSSMTKRTLLKGLEILGVVVLLATVLTAPFYTSLIENPWYKAITWSFVICLILIIAISVGLMPYFGMREMKRDAEGKLSQKEDELKDKAWLFNLASQELADLGNYLFSIVHTIDYTHLADTKVLRTKVELVNLTVFPLKIESASLDIVCSGYELGPKQQNAIGRIQTWGMRVQHDLEYPITNDQFLTFFKEQCQKRETSVFNFHIDWNLKTTIYNQSLLAKHDFEFRQCPNLPPRIIEAL